MKYVLKVLIDLEARDDIAARQAASAVVIDKLGPIGGVREIVLHSTTDHKSIRVNPDGTLTDMEQGRTWQILNFRLPASPARHCV